MSDLPGEITKQILSAPPRIIRSTRYSETAHGRSTPSSVLLPTGSSSLENASGCIRLPRPAAGIIPHISRPRRSQKSALCLGRPFEQLNQFVGTATGTVLFERALTCAAPHPLQLLVIKLKRSHYIGRSAGQDDLLIRLEKCVQSFPNVADHRRAASGGFEQATGRTPAPLHHRTSGDVKGQARRAEEGGVFGRRQMTNEINIGRPRKMLRVLSAADQEPSIRPQLRRYHQQGLEGVLAVFRVGSQIGKIGAIMRQRRRRMMQIRIDMTVEWS